MVAVKVTRGETSWSMWFRRPMIELDRGLLLEDACLLLSLSLRLSFTALAVCLLMRVRCRRV